MNRFDKIFGGVLLGFTIPVMIFCTFWWGSYLCGFDVEFWAILGIVLGVLADILFLKKLLSQFYYFGNFSIVSFYLLYSIGVFGFFMGVPVLNIVPGIIAGIYIGRRMKVRRQDKEIFLRNLRRTAGFSFMVLLFICLSSAFIAMNDPYTGANLQGMFNLQFEVTKPLILGVIIGGGTFLLLTQHVLLMKAGKIAFDI